MTKQEIKKLAKAKGWECVDDQDASCVLIFQKGTAKLNVWYTKMTVATTIDHPHKPRRQLFRRFVGPQLLSEIMDNPRIHTRKGFYTKNDLKRLRR